MTLDRIKDLRDRMKGTYKGLIYGGSETNIIRIEKVNKGGDARYNYVTGWMYLKNKFWTDPKEEQIATMFHEFTHKCTRSDDIGICTGTPLALQRSESSQTSRSLLA